MKGGSRLEQRLANSGSTALPPDASPQRTGESLCLLCRHRSQVAQIALVSDKHDDDVGISVISQFLQPPGDVLVCLVFADVVDEEGTDSSSVVG